MELVLGSARCQPCQAGAAEGIPASVTATTTSSTHSTLVRWVILWSGNRQTKVDPRLGEQTLSIIPDMNTPYLQGGSSASEPVALGPGTDPEDRQELGERNLI